MDNRIYSPTFEDLQIGTYGYWVDGSPIEWICEEAVYSYFGIESLRIRLVKASTPPYPPQPYLRVVGFERPQLLRFFGPFDSPSLESPPNREAYQIQKRWVYPSLADWLMHSWRVCFWIEAVL